MRGPDANASVKNFVLSSFQAEEKKKLPSLIELAGSAALQLIGEPIAKTLHLDKEMHEHQ